MKQYQQGCVGAFIQKENGSFLVVKRADDDEFFPGSWELPGGGSDFGEELQDTVVREIKEETGLDIIVGKPLAVHTHFMERKDEKVQRIEVTFLCQLSGNDAVTLSAEHTAYKWIKPGDIVHMDFSDYMVGVIQNALQNL